MLNCSVYQGFLRKRPGYTEYGGTHTAFASEVTGLYSTQDEQNNTYLYATILAKLYKWNTATDAWVEVTGTALTGGSGQRFSFETSQNKLVFSQGVDAVNVTDLGGATYSVLNANCPPAKYLTRFADRLVLGYTVESGSTKPYRIRRSVASDHTDWTGVGSGFTDLSEFPYHVKQIRKLGPRLVVYTESAIWVATRTGNSTAPYRFDMQVADLGTPASDTVQGRNDVHLFLGTDDIYEFNGAAVRPIAPQIRDELFATLNPAAYHRMFAEIRYDTQEYMLFVATGGQATPSTVWVYNWRRGIWYPWSVSGPLTSTTHRLDDTLTIDELSGTIDSQGWEFDARIIQEAYPAFLTGHSDGKVYVWGEQYPSDNGTAIPCHWVSQDFTSEQLGIQGQELTLVSLSVLYRGTGSAPTFDVTFSTDGGNTWTAAQQLTFGSQATGYHSVRLDYQVTGKRIRWKIAHNDSTTTWQISAFYPVFELRGMVL
jgi:hypothetical protein